MPSTQRDRQHKVFQDVSVYNSRIMGPAHVENVTSLACRTALAYRGVSHITIPVDLQDEVFSKSDTSSRNVPGHTSKTFADFSGTPGEASLEAAAEILNQGEKVAILAGRGAIGASTQLEELAETLGGVIIKPLLGKMAVPDDSPYTTGSVGLLGTAPSQEALEECDTLVIVGSSFPYIEYYPAPGQVRTVQIELDPMRIGLRHPVDVALVGDAKRVLSKLLLLLRRNEERGFLEKAQSGMADWNALMQERASRTDKPMKPQVVAWELGKRLADNAIFTSDSGTIATWYARHIPYRDGQMCFLSGNLATMANGFPYAIAAQIAYPDRQCVALVGDGGFTMLMGEFVNCVANNLPVKVVVIKNNTLGQIKWEQMVFLGNPEFGNDLAPIDFAAFAEACGGKGYTITEPGKCGDLLDEALAEPGPVIIEAVVDPHEPPMPPKTTVEQASKFAQSLARGTPNRERIAMTALYDKVREMI